MVPGNWKSYQDYYDRCSVFDDLKRQDEEDAKIENAIEEFVKCAVKRLGDEVEDDAEEFITEQDNEHILSAELETLVDIFEEWLEEKEK